MDYEAYIEAGKISYEALMSAKALIAPGKKYLEVADAAESYIRGKGFDIAFPVNISINEKAAHYTPTADDRSVFTANDVVKLDLGARKGTALGDCAVTVDLTGKYSKLLEATEKALDAALGTVKSGVRVCDIGAAVEQVADQAGFQPIMNLGGHEISEEALHGGIFVPNFDNGDPTQLEEGQIVAIEVFLTDGEGMVEDTGDVQIFQKLGPVTARADQTRKVADFIDSRFRTYPFAMRWLVREFGSEFTVKRALSELGSLGDIEAYPVLVERKKGIVAQFEKEVIVRKDGCDVITK